MDKIKYQKIMRNKKSVFLFLSLLVCSGSAHADLLPHAAVNNDVDICKTSTRKIFVPNPGPLIRSGSGHGGPIPTITKEVYVITDHASGDVLTENAKLDNLYAELPKIQEKGFCKKGVLEPLDEPGLSVLLNTLVRGNTTGYCVAKFGKKEGELIIVDAPTNETLYEYSNELDVKELIFKVMPKLNQEGWCEKGLVYLYPGKVFLSAIGVTSKIDELNLTEGGQ